MVTNNVTVYQFEVGLDEVFTDEVRFRVNVDCVIVVVVKDCFRHHHHHRYHNTSTTNHRHHHHHRYHNTSTTNHVVVGLEGLC